jgi:lysophospholipase L1-like esterase
MLGVCVLVAMLLAGCSGGGGSGVSVAFPAIAGSATTTEAPIHVAAVGDSITAGVMDDAAASDLANPDPYYHVDPTRSFAGVAASLLGDASPAILGVPKAFTWEMAVKQVPLIPLNATVVIAYGGTNDAFPHVDPAAVDDLVAAIRARVPKAKIVLLTVRHLVRWTAADAWVPTWNAHVRAVAKSSGAILVDQEQSPQPQDGYPDNMHPDAVAAAALGRTVAAAVMASGR